MSQPRTAGTLRVVATPLGNLGDFSERALRAVRDADAIAAEDTRRAGLLLEKLGIPKKPMVAVFSHREAARSEQIVERILSGQTFVLLTDGGTPGISDPGARLVQSAYRSGVRIEVIPGPSAVVMTLSVSSMGGGPFVFEGFLPSTRAKRRDRLRQLVNDPRPFVLFEAPHRIRECLEDVIETAGSERVVTMVREGTKIHEEIRESSAAALLESLPEKPRGEHTLVVAGASVPSEHIAIDPLDLLRFAETFGLSPEAASRRVAETFGVPRSRLLRRSRVTERPDEPGDESRTL